MNTAPGLTVTVLVLLAGMVAIAMGWMTAAARRRAAPARGWVNPLLPPGLAIAAVLLLLVVFAGRWSGTAGTGAGPWCALQAFRGDLARHAAADTPVPVKTAANGQASAPAANGQVVMTAVPARNPRPQGGAIAKAGGNGVWHASPSLKWEPGVEPVKSRVTRENDKAIVVEYRMPALKCIPVMRKDGKDVKQQEERVVLGNAPRTGGVGCPVLPVIPSRVLLPLGREVEKVEVVAGRKVALAGTHYVEVGQKPYPLLPDMKPEPTPPDKRFYESDEPYPKEPQCLVGVQWKRGAGVLLVNLHPVEYRPRSGALAYYETMELKVTLKPAEGGEKRIRYRPDPVSPVEKEVENPGATGTYQGSAAPVGGGMSGGICNPKDKYQYVIITSAALADAPGDASQGIYNFNDLLAAKAAKGISGTIVTVQEIYSEYSGRDNQEKIRNFIIDAYNNWDTDYVLLAGDADGKIYTIGETEPAVVPVRALDCNDVYVHGNIASDMYYQCLDGDWDYDGDGIFGRTGDGPGGGVVDAYAEVYVGRAPVSTPEHVSTFVGKCLKYAAAAHDSYSQKALFVGEYLGFGGVSDYATDSMEEIRQGGAHNGVTCAGFPAYFNCGTLYDSSGYTWDKSEIISRINSNTYNQIHHLGHCANHHLMRMEAPNSRYGYSDKNDMPSIQNDKLVFIYSQGCFPGSFDNFAYWTSDYTEYDCVAEDMLVKMPGGMAAGVLMSRYGWGMRESTDGPSQWFHREFMDAYFGECITSLGGANAKSHEENAWRLKDFYISGYDMSGYARWCMYESNLFGDPEMNLNGISTGPYIQYRDSQSTIATGNGDAIVNPGEELEITVELANCGLGTAAGVAGVLTSSSGYVTVLTNTAAFGDMAGRGSMATGMPPYRVRISEECPGNTVIPFQLAVSDAGTNLWTLDLPSVTVFHSSVIAGRVFDAGSGLGITGAVVTYAGPWSGAVTSEVDGAYSISPLIDGSYTCTVTHAEYLSATSTVTTPPAVTDLNFGLVYPGVGVEPLSLEATCENGATAQVSFSVMSTGTAPLVYNIYTSSGRDGMITKTLPPVPTNYYVGYQGIDWGGDVLWIAGYDRNISSNVIIKQNIESGLITETMNMPVSGFSIGWDGSCMWVGDMRAIYRFDPATGAILFTINMDPQYMIDWALDMAWDGTNMWVISEAMKPGWNPGSPFYLSKYSTSGTMLLRKQLTDWSWTLAWDGDYLWTTTWDSPPIAIAFDTSANEVYRIGLESMSNPVTLGGLTFDGKDFWTGGSQASRIDMGRTPWLSLAGPKRGTLDPGAEADYMATITPVSLAAGTHKINIKVRSNDLKTPLASLPLTLTVPLGADQAPVITAYAPPTPITNILEGTSMVFSCEYNDPDGDSLTVTWTADGRELFLATSSNCTYETDFKSAGQHTIMVAVDDRKGGVATQAWDVTVLNVNRAPWASDSTNTTVENVPVQFYYSYGDLDNEWPLTMSILSGPDHGRITTNSYNVYYSPDVNWSGTDTLSYVVTDPCGAQSNTGIVTFVVAWTNQPPLARDQALVARMNTDSPIMLAATDPEGQSLTYSVVSQPRHGTLLGAPPNVIYMPATDYTGYDDFSFKANDGTLDSNVGTISITVADRLYWADMESDPGWALEPEWAYGAPQGAGNLDPMGGHTGMNVVGYNLAGDYSNEMAEARYAWTPAIDCSGHAKVHLSFWRWLTVDSNDCASIEISRNGSDWQVAWTNAGAIEDRTWTNQVLNIGTLADGEPTVYVRWGMGPTDGADTRGGWNLDDVEVRGVLTARIVASAGAVLVPEGGTSAFQLRLNQMPEGDTTVTVSRVSGSAGITVQTGGVLVFTMNNWDVCQTVTLAAATDPDDVSEAAVIACKAPGMPQADVTAREIDKDLSAVVSTDAVTINEASTNSFQVRISAAPVNAVTVTVSRASGSAGITVQSGETLVFTPSNWNKWQTVILAAAQDADVTNETAVIRCAGIGIANPADVLATENDVDAPRALDQLVFTFPDTSKAIQLRGTDWQGRPLTYTVVDGPVNGRLAGTAPDVVYTPSRGFRGTDTFTFKVNNGLCDSGIGTVTILVADQDPSLVAWWKLDETDGTLAADASGHGHAGNVQGATWTDGRRGGALLFQGANDMVLVDSRPMLTEEWTIAAWFTAPLPDTATWHTLTRGNGADHQIITDGSLNLGVYDNNDGGFRGCGYCMTNLAAGWHHIAAVGSGTATKFYVDGTYVGTSDRKSTSDVYCLGNYQGGNQRFSDKIDDVRVYNRALSGPDVNELVTGGYPCVRIGRVLIEIVGNSLQVRVCFDSQDGWTYQLECRSDLTDAEGWRLVTEAVHNTSTELGDTLDVTLPGDMDRCFLRIRAVK